MYEQWIFEDVGIEHNDIVSWSFLLKTGIAPSSLK